MSCTCCAFTNSTTRATHVERFYFYCMLYLFIVLYCVASSCVYLQYLPITAVYGEWVSLAIVSTCTWFYIFTVVTAIYCFTSYDKCTFCKSFCIKVSAKCTCKIFFFMCILRSVFVFVCVYVCVCLCVCVSEGRNALSEQVCTESFCLLILGSPPNN